MAPKHPSPPVLLVYIVRAPEELRRHTIITSEYFQQISLTGFNHLLPCRHSPYLYVECKYLRDVLSKQLEIVQANGIYLSRDLVGGELSVTKHASVGLENRVLAKLSDTIDYHQGVVL